MAKFHNYYVLCPLIDQKSFLGVSDAKEADYVIVSLGRNVVNKYRLSDQKQIGGWTSRDHITSQVIYDKEQENYVGIFNNNTVKLWKDDDDNLDKVKKYKFPVNMLKLIPRGDQAALIIFSNGNCASLPYAIDNRKTYESQSLIKDRDVILEMAAYKINNVNHVCYIIKNNKDCYEILTCPVREELGDMERSKISREKITRPEDVHIVGQYINILDKSIAVYVLWSDTKIMRYDLTKKSWKSVGSVPWISTSSRVSIAWMGRHHLILFGSNTEQDGAVIVVYNVTLGIGACKYPMKMYSENAKLYCFHGHVILEASNHIGMLPYVLETRRNLSSLLGSHEVSEDEGIEIANWETSTELHLEVADDMKDPLSRGIPERLVCSQVLAPMLERLDAISILRVIHQFKDIPEPVLVQLLHCAIQMTKAEAVDLTKDTEFNEFCETHETDNSGFQLLRYMFKITFSDALLIPYLRDGISLDDSLFLMKYVTYLLINSESHMDPEFESKLIDWCTLIIDSFYQQYVLTKDSKVTHVLQAAISMVMKLIDHIEIFNKTMMVLNQVLTSKGPAQEETLPYTIELMNI